MQTKHFADTDDLLREGRGNTGEGLDTSTSSSVPVSSEVVYSSDSCASISSIALLVSASVSKNQQKMACFRKNETYYALTTLHLFSMFGVQSGIRCVNGQRSKEIFDEGGYFNNIVSVAPNIMTELNNIKLLTIQNCNSSLALN